MTITKKLFQFAKPYKSSYRFSSTNKKELEKRRDFYKRKGLKPSRIGKLWRKKLTFAFSYNLKTPKKRKSSKRKN